VNNRGASSIAMFGDLRHARTLLQQDGSFLIGDYSIASSGISGIDFEPSSMEKPHHGGLDDQSVKRALKEADDAQRVLTDDINAGFGRIEPRSS
jgi:hypothetical protein